MQVVFFARQSHNITKVTRFTYFLALSIFLAFSSRLLGQDLEQTGSNLPIGIIDTYGQTIIQTTKVQVGFKLVYKGEGLRTYPSDVSNPLYVDYDGEIGIEIRGSSSSSFPKKQYSAETRAANGSDINVSLLGLASENDWVFSAPYSDKSLMRNVVAYELSRRMGQWAPRTVYFELIIDGDYKGVYHLTEKIKQDKARVDIAKLDNDDVAGDSLTGGYIMAVDRFASGDQLDVEYFRTPYGSSSRNYIYKDPKGDKLQSSQRSYLKNWWLDFENQTVNGSVSDPMDGMANYIDVDSFLDQVILRELGKDVDAYILSWFMHKDRNDKNRHLVGGPIWDMNLAFSNANYRSGDVSSGWQIDNGISPTWMVRLFQNDDFQRELANRWNELRLSDLTTVSIQGLVDETRTYLDESSIRNFQRWNILGTYVWPNPNGYEDRDTYQKEVTYLRDWFANRAAWMDGQLSPGSCGEPLVINEIHYNSVVGFVPEDWIELHNPNIFAVNVGNWVLHDENATSGFELPSVTIPAGGYHVLAQDNSAFQSLFSGISNVSGSFGSASGMTLRNSGEKLILVDDSGCFVDKVEFDDAGVWPSGADGSGRSIELTDFNLDNRLGANWQVSEPFGGTPGQGNSDGIPPNVCNLSGPDLAINEIMYAPLTGEGDDWVELVNRSGGSVDISAWSLSDGNPDNYYFFPFGTSIDSNGFLVLAEELTEFSSHYPSVSNVIGSFGFGLSGIGSRVVLRNAFLCEVDEVEYTNASPWPEGAQDTGKSIEWSGESDNSDSAEWQESPDFGGSPGEINPSSVFEAAWISPRNGAFVGPNRSVLAEVEAFSGKGISQVEILLDGVVLGDASLIIGRLYALDLGVLDDGIYELSARVTDDSGDLIQTPAQSICVGPLSTGPFLETAGIVTFEAENYSVNIPRADDSWQQEVVNPSFVGQGYMVTLPDDGSKVISAYAGNVAELQYEIDFETTGTFYLHYRGWADDGTNNSVHFGLDGGELGTLQDVGLGSANYASWFWANSIDDGSRAKFDISTPGLHTINLWMREDGTNVDRIVITDELNSQLIGQGPAESYRLFNLDEKGVRLDLTVLLGGAWTGSQLRTDLVENDFLPVSQPYSFLPELELQSDYFSTRQLLVDWVWVELRTEMGAASVVARQPAFVDKDGNVLSWNSDDYLNFGNVLAGNYYVVIGHRNHLSIISESNYSLEFDAPTTVNFSTDQSQVFGADAQMDLGGGKFGLWPGDTSGNGEIRFTGGGNDRVEVLNISGGPSPFDFAEGYYWEDTSLDGRVVYSGASNDRTPILIGAGGPSAFSYRQSQVPD